MDLQQIIIEYPILGTILVVLFGGLTAFFSFRSSRKVEKLANPQKEKDKNNKHAEKMIITDFDRLRSFHEKQVALIDKEILRGADKDIENKLISLKEYHLSVISNISALVVSSAVDLSAKKGR